MYGSTMAKLLFRVILDSRGLVVLAVKFVCVDLKLDGQQNPLGLNSLNYFYRYMKIMCERQSEFLQFR